MNIFEKKFSTVKVKSKEIEKGVKIQMWKNL